MPWSWSCSSIELWEWHGKVGCGSSVEGWKRECVVWEGPEDFVWNFFGVEKASSSPEPEPKSNKRDTQSSFCTESTSVGHADDKCKGKTNPFQEYGNDECLC